MNAKEQAQARWDHVAKPLNSLGKLEKLIVMIAGVQNTPDVRINKRCALVFCGDHGVVAEGVSQSGSEVTALVAKSIAEGTANINLMAGASYTDVFAVDMGMVGTVPGTIDRRIVAGTRNMVHGSAMTRVQAEQAIQAGINLVGEMKAHGYQIIATGEMGIGNTTASTAMACTLLDCTPEELTGRGAGLSDAGLIRKREAITRALEVNQPDANDPIDVLSKVGGFEIAGMVGAFLGGMQHGVPVIIDGVISAVAALVAARICPAAVDAMLPSHMSREPAMALLPMLDMALRVYHGPHTFDDLGMAAYTPQEEQA